MILGAMIALIEGDLYLHATAGSPLGWIFAPSALVVGALFIGLAIRLGKQR